MKDNDTNHEFPESLTVTLDKQVTSLNGSEAWGEYTLREPNFSEAAAFWKESEKTNSYEAMATLMATISGVNKFAFHKMPIRKFREGQAYLLDFLSWYPTKMPG